MSQSAIVAVAAAFVANGVLTYTSGMTGLDASMSWIVSGIVAFVAGYATMKMGKK